MRLCRPESLKMVERGLDTHTSGLVGIQEARRKRQGTGFIWKIQ